MYLYIHTQSLTPSLPHFLVMSHYSSLMEEQHHQEMQLFSSSSTPYASSTSSSHPPSEKFRSTDRFDPSLDLQLSMSLTPFKKPPNNHRSDTSRILIRKVREYNNMINDGKTDSGCLKALKWQAAEQIRLAAMEKAYAERVRELTRREMELAESEFARARSMWERAREEVERAEQMKARAMRKIDSTCLEITCQSCRQKFRP